MNRSAMNLSTGDRDDASADPRRGPDAAFAALFRDHFDFVHRNLRRLGVPPATVDDAAQEVFLVVLRRPDAPVTSLRGWLFGIARRIAWRQRRSVARRTRLVEALAHEPTPATDGATAVAEREAAALLESFLERLDDDKRAVFLLAELEQMTAPEIAASLGIKANTVYSRLRAARQEFDRCFERVRLRERRAVGAAETDERALLLSRARRAHEPTPAQRQRAWIVLCGQLGGAGPAGGSTDATLAEAGEAAQAGGWTVGGHAAWAGLTAIFGALAITAGQALSAGPDPGREPPQAAVSQDRIEETPAAAPPVRPAPPVLTAMTAGTAVSPPAPTQEPARPRRTRAVSSAPRPEERTETTVVAPLSPTSPSSPPSPPSPATTDADALRREAALMAAARAELQAGAWGQARALLERHAQDFPAGALADERRLSWIKLLCSEGQVAVARAEAARLAGERPGSAVARKAAAMCPRENSPTDGVRSGD